VISPALNSGGSNNWSEVDWSDRDVGEYTNLCPDDQCANFEYGSLCIVGWVKFIAELSLHALPPSKITVKLRQLDKALDRLPLQVAARLYDHSNMVNPVSELKLLIEREIAATGGGHLDHDRARNELAEDAWSIWIAHHGDIKKDRFADYIDRLIINSGFATADRSKSRISTDNLVRDIRSNSTRRSPRLWNLWGA
jgi:hypothetical protein